MMAKKLRKILAMLLVLTMVAGALCLPAFALDGTVIKESETITNPDGTETNQKTTTTTETDSKTGKITITVTVEKVTDDTTEDGVKVKGEEFRTDTTVTDEDGNMLQESWHEKGYEKREWEEELPADAELPEVKVELNPGETTTESVSEPAETIIIGDVPSSESDKSYDYEKQTTTVEREANASVSEIESTEEQFGDIGLESIHPEEYDKTNINRPAGTAVVPKNAGNYHAHQVTDDDGNVILTKYYPITNRKQSEYDVLPDEVKANYAFDEESGLWKPNGGEKYSAEENGIWWDYVYDADGEQSESGSAITRHNEGGAYQDYTDMFILFDKVGNMAYAYCMDSATNTQKTYRYTIENLEEADYFVGTEEEQAEAKAHVRAIALNGYWGTESGVGSLQNLKAGLRAAIADNVTITFGYRNGSKGDYFQFDSSIPESYSEPWYDEEGNPVLDKNGNPCSKHYFGRDRIDDMITDINEGDALTATQGSFWQFGREDNGWLGFYPDKGNDVEGALALYGGAEARMMLIQQYLIGDYLKEKVASENRETTLTDKDSFLEEDSLALVIGDKVADHANNADTNDTNDVYNIDLSFAMVVEPTENDDLVVVLYTIDSDGSVNELRRARLAGDASGDDGSYSELIKSGNSYTFKDIQMAENNDLTFDLKVEGTQNLVEGVYIYKYTNGFDNGQTLVGVSHGDHRVEVDSKFTVRFDVEDHSSIKVEHYWESSGNPVNTPDAPDSDPDSDPDPDPTPDSDPGSNPDPAPIPDPDPDLDQTPDPEETPGEVPPLANVPRTGDISAVWFVLAVLSATALLGVSFCNKRRA